MPVELVTLQATAQGNPLRFSTLVGSERESVSISLAGIPVDMLA
jgi:hypothetical protein